MLNPEQFDRIIFAMPFLQRADETLKQELRQHAGFANIPAGHDVFVEGDRVESIALLISGMVRVYKIGETGREITLYRFGLGQSCILTANAILSRKIFPADCHCGGGCRSGDDPRRGIPRMGEQV